MISEKMMGLGKKSSVIREIFEYGKKRKAEILRNFCLTDTANCLFSCVTAASCQCLVNKKRTLHTEGFIFVCKYEIKTNRSF